VVHAGAVLGSPGFGFVRDDSTGRFEEFPQFGTLEIGDDVSIGANVTIDRGTFGATTIGRGTKIDNLVQVAHNVRIGDNVIVAAQTGIAGSAVVEDGAVLGGQVGIADHVRICAGVRVGGQAGVPSNKVLRGAPGDGFWGTPARPVRQVLHEQAVLARLSRR
jgi:UDP-3-O-[3-hydroxymyristoyl] glucosamine N-acyltransferase